MSLLTLPLIAADLDGRGVFYPGHCAALGEHGVVWFDSPALPDASWTWADDTLVTTPHAVLDLGHVAELLHLFGVEPDALDDAEAFAAIAWSLAAVHCDMVRCAAEVGADIAEHVAGAAGARYGRCVLRAGRLLGTEA